jgi:hypothetical protein
MGQIARVVHAMDLIAEVREHLLVAGPYAFAAAEAQLPQRLEHGLAAVVL